jgi:hypothetical protein
MVVNSIEINLESNFLKNDKNQNQNQKKFDVKDLIYFSLEYLKKIEYGYFLDYDEKINMKEFF